MISSQQEMMAYKEACALNNWGVSMLLRGDYEDAATTIKDALSVLRLVLSPNNEHKSNLTNTVQRKTKKAVARLQNFPRKHVVLHIWRISLPLNRMISNSWDPPLFLKPLPLPSLPTTLSSFASNCVLTKKRMLNESLASCSTTMPYHVSFSPPLAKQRIVLWMMRTRVAFSLELPIDHSSWLTEHSPRDSCTWTIPRKIWNPFTSQLWSYNAPARCSGCKKIISKLMKPNAPWMTWWRPWKTNIWTTWQSCPQETYAPRQHKRRIPHHCTQWIMIECKQI